MIVKKKPANPIKTPKKNLERYDRAFLGNGEVAIDRQGGPRKFGSISGVSVIAMGEALGHEQWIDRVALEQVADGINELNRGVKARFTHPGMSNDGLGRHLGRVTNAYVDGTKVRGDLYFAESSHATPEGDLAEYVMNLVEEDPEAAGLSIVFEHDRELEESFMEEYSTDNGFLSPDPANSNDYPHIRIGKLRAADVVDEPAANPDGLFDRQDLPREMYEFMDYVTGLSQDRPTACLGLDPERASAFLSRWLADHQLELSEPKAMTKNVETPEAPAPSKDELLKDLDRWTDSFGAENGLKWYREGISFEDGLTRELTARDEVISELRAENEELKGRLQAVSLGEDEPVEVAPAAPEKKVSIFSFADSPSSN